MHALEPYAIGCKRAPVKDKSKLHIPLFRSMSVAVIDASLESGCIIIHAIPRAHQSVLIKVGFDAS